MELSASMTSSSHHHQQQQQQQQQQQHQVEQHPIESPQSAHHSHQSPESTQLHHQQQQQQQQHHHQQQHHQEQQRFVPPPTPEHLQQPSIKDEQQHKPPASDPSGNPPPRPPPLTLPTAYDPPQQQQQPQRQQHIDTHLLAPPSSASHLHTSFPAITTSPAAVVPVHHHHHHHHPSSNALSPSNSHTSTPTPSPISSPSPPFHTTQSGLIDLNSIVSYSQLIQRRDEVMLALKYRSGDHLAAQALDLLKSGRERVKRYTAAGRLSTGKPPVKHIQEQYLAVFSRFSDYCTSQHIPTWPVEPVRVAIWVLAMQEKAPPTPATLRQYITRLEFTCTATAGLFEPEFGPSSPLKASALLRELVNRDLPGQTMGHRSHRGVRTGSSGSSKALKPILGRTRTLEGEERSITPPQPPKKWQHPFHPGVSAGEYLEHGYEGYLAPFATTGGYGHQAPLIAHHHHLWPPGHHPERYPTEGIPHPIHYPPMTTGHPAMEHHPRSHEFVPHHHRQVTLERPFTGPYPTHQSFTSVPPNHHHEGRYITEPTAHSWT